jgi:hypothetical protein
MRGMPARERERGVSDVVAFVLTFSIIIFGVGLVSTGAFDALVQFSDDQQVQNSERGLQSAAAALDNINQNNDTYREFDVGVAGGDVFYNQTWLNVTVENGTGATPVDREIRIDALEKRFDEGDTALTYEGGGVFRSPSASARYEPKLRCSSDSRIGENTVIISLINLTTDNTIREADSYDNDVAVSPTGVLEEAPVGANSEVARFSATLIDQNRTLHNGTSLDVSIDVSGTAYPEQWGNYLDDAGWDKTHSCNADTVLIRITTVELSQIDF